MVNIMMIMSQGSSTVTYCCTYTQDRSTQSEAWILLVLQFWHTYQLRSNSCCIQTSEPGLYCHHTPM